VYTGAAGSGREGEGGGAIPSRGSQQMNKFVDAVTARQALLEGVEGLLHLSPGEYRRGVLRRGLVGNWKMGVGS
jgi:hypothetical protein